MGKELFYFSLYTLGSLFLPKIQLPFDSTFSADNNNRKNYFVYTLTTELNGLPCKESDSLQMLQYHIILAVLTKLQPGKKLR